MSLRIALPLTALAATLTLGACSESDGDGLALPTQYEFESRFVAGESSVNYQGQICRHVLISALTQAVRDSDVISDPAYRGENIPYYDDTIVGARAEQSTQTTLGLDLPVPEGQDTLGELCGSKYLDQKFAGNDTVTDHRDWNTQFVGIEGEVSAEAYLRRLVREASTMAAQGTSAIGAPSYVSPEGLDYAQLIQKFLLGAVAFAQGTDDYLDDDVAGKGLLAAWEQDGDAPYAKLEHQIDEGYGYFGAARAYALRSDEVNRSGVVDDNNDGFIDLLAEHNFGASTNAAKRDVGSAAEARTDLTAAAFDNLLRLRALVSEAQTDLASMSESRAQQVRDARNAAVAAWEEAYAATVVHYINDTLADLAAIDAGGFDIADLAKHWSEMKGFALGLQFNPRSPLHELITPDTEPTRFARLHELLGDTPPCAAGVCSNDPQYRQDLLAARTMLGEAYGFAQANLEAW